MRFVLVCAALYLVSHNLASATDLTAQSAPRDVPLKLVPTPLDLQKIVGKTAAAPGDETVLVTAHAVPVSVEYSRQELCDVLMLAARAYDLPVAFFARLIWQESGFRTHIISSAGAQGIAQFMPDTAAERGIEDPF